LLLTLFILFFASRYFTAPYSTNSNKQLDTWPYKAVYNVLRTTKPPGWSGALRNSTSKWLDTDQRDICFSIRDFSSLRLKIPVNRLGCSKRLQNETRDPSFTHHSLPYLSILLWRYASMKKPLPYSALLALRTNPRMTLSIPATTLQHTWLNLPVGLWSHASRRTSRRVPLPSHRHKRHRKSLQW
jgi:hypothetical protein